MKVLLDFLPPYVSAPARRPLVGLAVFWLVFSLLLSAQHYTTELAYGRAVGGWPVALANGFSKGVAWGLVSLAAFWLTGWLPPERDRSLRAAGSATGAALLIAATKLLTDYAVVRLLCCTPDPTFLQLVASRFATTLLATSLLFGLAYGIHAALRQRQQQRSISRLEATLTQAQLQALKLQLSPHFLFNALNAIVTLTRHDPAHAERMLIRLADMLRTTLAYRDIQQVTLEEEVHALQPYVELEQLRLHGRLAVDFDVDPETARALVPHLLIQPLIENAVRHGIAPRGTGGRVQVSARRDGSRLRIRVIDDGIGVQAARERGRAGGVGLASTRHRLEALYGPAVELEVAPHHPDGTEVSVVIPFIRSTLPPPPDAAEPAERAPLEVDARRRAAPELRVRATPAPRANP